MTLLRPPFWLFLLFPLSVVWATPPRNVSVDIGFGVPQLIFGQGQAKISDTWQVGLSYGIVPGYTSVAATALPSQNLTLGPTNEPFTLSPTITPAFNTLSPFIRYFPRKTNFYIQFTYNMLQAKGDVSGVFRPQSGDDTLIGALAGTVSLTQPIPTLSIGNIFCGKAYFINFSMGFSYIMNASANVALTSTLPDALGGSAANEAALSQLSTQITDSINTATAQLRSEYPIFPSISLSFGIML